MVSTHITSDVKSPSKAKRIKLSRIVPSVSREFLANDMSNVKQLSKIFDRKEICVLIGNKEYSKKHLEAKVVENGGKIVQNPGMCLGRC